MKRKRQKYPMWFHYFYGIYKLTSRKEGRKVAHNGKPVRGTFNWTLAEMQKLGAKPINAEKVAEILTSEDNSQPQ